MGDRPSVTVLDSWSSISEKTVFILDRSKYFTQVSSGHFIDGDCLKDSKKTAHLYANEEAIRSFNRSLWTCTVEAVVGYSRLVWDLFTPDQRCMTILSIDPSDSESDKTNKSTFVEKLCSWQDEEQNLDHFMKALARKSYLHQVSHPTKLETTTDISNYPNCASDSLFVCNALDQALGEIGLLTKAQLEKKYSNRGGSNPATSDNNGRIILISSFQSQDTVDQLISRFESMIEKKNEQLIEAIKQSSETSANIPIRPINYCDLVIINTFPIQDEGPCSKINESKSFRPNFHCKTYSVRSGRIIAGLLNNLCLQHHNLRSTTITGIPMKEEQNASSSSQYDVEIVHCSSIHDDILNSGSPLLEGVTEIIDRNGFPCDTFKLSWCTPRTTAIELNHCVATSRITAVDVNSRPSSCLTNFLLNGRAVMLEIFKSKSNRMATHILASHNGELYIHSLATMQQKLGIGDPPPISDHLGGKVGDYRMNDFVTFMKQHTLCKAHASDEPLNRTLNMIKRQTLYWPLTLGHTILLNVPNLVGPILQCVPKDLLTPADVDECKKVIDNLIKSEKEGQALPSVSIVDLIKTASSKGGGAKLEQLYKLLWNELEYFLRVHSTTPEHEAIVDYLIERHGGDRKHDGDRGIKRTASKAALSSPPRKTTKVQSQLIPEIINASAASQETAIYYKSGVSLWQLWTQLYHQFHKCKNKLPFIGRFPMYPTSMTGSISNEQS